MSRGYPLGELARRVRGTVHGDPGRLLVGIATLEQAEADQLSFLTNSRYREAAAATRAGALLVGPGVRVPDHDLLEVAQPYGALADLLELFHPEVGPDPGISADARVAENVSLGRDVSIGPFAVVEERCVLGDRVVIGAASVVGAGCRLEERTELKPRVVLYPGTVLGARCLVHSGVVLGGDGFGFAPVGGRHRKVPQLGRVVLEDDVEIGANSTVDRSMLGETRIGEGSKIDNLVMIAHGVRIGRASLLVAQAGVAGSASLGERTTVAGQSGVSGHLTLGDGVTVAAKSAVFSDLPDGAFVAGVPAVDHRQWKRAQVLLKKLPELRGEIRELRERLAALEKRLPGEN